MYIYTQMHARMHIYTQMHAHMHTHPTPTHTCTHECTHTHTHTHTHAHTHACTHTPHTHTHKDMLHNTSYSVYRIAENFRGRKLSRIGEKCDFRGENFHGLLAFAAPKDATPPNFAEKTFADSHKSAKFTKVFSLKSFPLYGIPQLVTVVNTK